MRDPRPCPDERNPAGCRRADPQLHLLVIVLVVIAAGRIAGAQEFHTTFGAIPPEDLAMTSFPADTNARAVVLYDYGELTYNQHDEPCFVRHRRVKILSPEAYERWGTVTIPFWAGGQKVSDVEAYTRVLGPDGSTRDFHVDPASIFDEKTTGEFHRLRFTLPGLAPGCVIEYRYRVVPSRLDDWQFQSDEPTVWSEFRMERPEMLEYAVIQQAIPGFFINESKTIPNPADRYGTKVAQRWVMKDLPALRREPFMTAPGDFRATIRFQASRWVEPGGREHEIMRTWETLTGYLLGDKDFGGWLNPPDPLGKTARDLARDVTDPAEVIRRIHRHVRSNMTWTGNFSPVAGGQPEVVVKQRRGNSAEINLLLTAMLRAAGLRADPVLISTREHGRPVDVFPLIRQFDDVLAHVQVDKTEYLLDATDPLQPWDLLPEATLNDTGWLVSREDPGWVDIASPRTTVDTVSVTAVLDADGTITGRLEARERGYRALESRHDLRDKKEKDHVRERWLAGFADARLDSFTVMNKDSCDAPLVTRVWFAAVGQAQVAGNRIYLNPVLFNRLKENPLSAARRGFPVDFGHGSESIYSLNLALPDGFRVEERPQDLQLTVGRDGGRFARTVQENGNGLTLTMDRQVRQSVFQPAEYRGLRDYYDRLVAALGEQVVLAKAAAAGGAR